MEVERRCECAPVLTIGEHIGGGNATSCSVEYQNLPCPALPCPALPCPALPARPAAARPPRGAVRWSAGFRGPQQPRVLSFLRVDGVPPTAEGGEMSIVQRIRWNRLCATLTFGVAVAAAAACGPPAAYSPSPTDPITFGAGGVAGNESASSANTSADGVWTTFNSRATNLVPGDTNGRSDTFLRNNSTGAVTRIAESTADEARLTANGRYLSYREFGSPGYATYRVLDRVTSTTTTWTRPGSLNTPIVSEDGTQAIYGAGSSFGIFQVYCRIRDLAAGTEIDCPPGGPGYGTVTLEGASSNGRFVMYYWNDQNGGGTSGHFLYDITTATQTPLTGPFISLGTNIVSDDGNWVLAAGFGLALPVTINDLVNGTSVLFPGVPAGNNVVPVGISPNGRYMAALTAPPTPNAIAEMYVYDRVDDTVTLASTAFGTGAVLPSGVSSCGLIVGQVNNSGQVCMLTADPMSPTDTNLFVDGYLSAPLL